jgi:ABC-type bacteriocin/lantibiotic exporter with double-glycine peptidase domain
MVDDSRVFDSLRQAELLDFVKQLPNGIDTFIGEGGIRLSGGQRQRVALARAFYFNRNVLIMDESTSSLDNETEREIIREVKSIKGKRTLIIVAHRMSTVQHCDRIYRMHNGEIIDEGDYHSVVEKSVLGSVKFE